ncbi:MAG TPA: hypothetical protein VGE77_13540 [Nocardioides sp.]
MDPSGQLLLRPGSHVARRTDGRLHVGLTTGAATTVPDTADVRRLLAARRSGADAAETLGPPSDWSPETRLADLGLHRARLLVDAPSALRAAQDAGRSVPDGEGAVAALLGEDPARALDRVAARRAAVVGLTGDVGVDELDALLQSGLVGHTIVGAEVPADPRDGSGPTVVLTLGEPDRDRSDTLVAAGVPHLWVAVLPDRVRIGPFVQVGATACLRCVDAAQREHDPQLPVVLAQSSGTVPGVLADPVDPVGLALGIAATAREVLLHVDGDVPTTWSATLDLVPDGTEVRRTWARHPWCGCSWQDGTDPPA